MKIPSEHLSAALSNLGRRELYNYEDKNLLRILHKTNYVYYLKITHRASGTVYYKIGCAIDVDIRVSKLRAENSGCKIEVLSYVPYTSSFEAYEYELMVKFTYKAASVRVLRTQHPFKTGIREIFTYDVLGIDK
jgi:hypothetical protein